MIYATKKLLDRVTSWGSPTLCQADALPEQGVFSDWYGTYAIIAKQHMVVLVNMSTCLTVVIPAKEFKMKITCRHANC